MNRRDCRPVIADFLSICMHNINELMAHNEDNRIFQKKTTMDLFECLAIKSKNELKIKIVQGALKEYSFGKNQDLHVHVDMIRREFVGRTELELYHALLMVMIRRKINLQKNIQRARDLWAYETDFLCRNLDSRWLVSACDTIMDYWPEDTERALAATGALFTNTLKLYETERWVTGQADATQQYEMVNGRVSLHDGLSAFVIGHGDMVVNLHRRIRHLCSGNTPAGKILYELLSRASKFDTVFKRFKDVHRDESTNWATLFIALRE